MTKMPLFGPFLSGTFLLFFCFLASPLLHCPAEARRSAKLLHYHERPKIMPS